MNYSKRFNAIPMGRIKCVDFSSSKQNAFCALEITRRVTNMINNFLNCPRFEINDVREFDSVNLTTYKKDQIQHFILNFIIVTQNISLGKHKRILREIIYDVLNEYSGAKNIRLNFKIILDKIYEKSRKIIVINYIPCDSELYLNDAESVNVSHSNGSQRNLNKNKSTESGNNI